MTFGFFLCLDTFLYVFTLLPLRVILALLRLITVPCCGLRYCSGRHVHIISQCWLTSLYRKKSNNLVTLYLLCFIFRLLLVAAQLD